MPGRGGWPRGLQPSPATVHRLRMADLSDDELLAELGVTIEDQKTRTYTPREERIIAGFEDIVRFYEAHGRAPQHGEDRDIFERLYAVRLDRLRKLDECRDLLVGMDSHGLLAGATEVNAPPAEIDDDALLAELGIEPSGEDDIRVLRHVQTAEERRAAEEVANRDERSEEHTSELQSRENIVCRLLLEKKKRHILQE